jgi:hypothetical protein
MSEEDFKRFCNAMAQSCAYRASVLAEESKRLDRDEFGKKHRIEKRIELLTDQMEVWAAAPYHWDMR